MGYVAVRGGGKAIEESLKLLEYQRVNASSAWGTDEIEGTFQMCIRDRSGPGAP